MRLTTGKWRGSVLNLTTWRLGSPGFGNSLYFYSLLRRTSFCHYFVFSLISFFALGALGDDPPWIPHLSSFGYLPGWRSAWLPFGCCCGRSKASISSGEIIFQWQLSCVRSFASLSSTLFFSGEPTTCLPRSEKRWNSLPRRSIVERPRASLCWPIECFIIPSTYSVQWDSWSFNRSFFSCNISLSLWLQKLVLLDTYRRLLKNLRWEKVTMISYTGIFAATYAVVQIVTFTECDPFNHYWIVLPDPGEFFPLQVFLVIFVNKTRHMLPGTAPIDRSRYVLFCGKYLQCKTSNRRSSPGVLNIITDLMLIALPIPILVLVKRSTAE